MAADYGAVREHVSHPGSREIPRQPRGEALHRVAGAEAGFAAPSRADGAGCGYLRISPSEKRTLDLITDHPMIPREHLANWLGVSEGRVSQMMHSLVNTWGLVERRGNRGDTRYTLSAEGIRYVTHRDRAQFPTTQGIWSTALTTDRQGRRRHVGHRIDTWARQTKHADGITWFLSKLEAETRADPDSELLWSDPPPGPTGPTTGAIRPSHPTPWDICSPAAFTCRSTSSTSFAPVTPGESLAA